MSDVEFNLIIKGVSYIVLEFVRKKLHLKNPKADKNFRKFGILYVLSE